MRMEEALVARLFKAAAPATVDWFDRPRGQFPAVTLTKVSLGREWTMAGPDGLDEPRVQIDCWALTKTEVAALARKVLAEMEQGRTVKDVTFHPASLELERWPPAESLDGGIVAFRIQMDFLFFFEEA